jgi:hypothetical protein
MESWQKDALAAANKVAHGEGDEEDAILVADAYINEMSHGRNYQKGAMEYLRCLDYRRSLLHT